MGLKNWRKQLKRVLPSSVGMVLLCSQPGWSHGAIATVTPTFTVEASYGAGDPMALAQVVVYSPDNPTEPWATGKTDQQGKYEFDPDAAGNWEVVVRQAGHGTTVVVPVGTTMVAQTPAVASPVSTSSGPLNRWASAGAGLWGLVGTVLFFSRGKQAS